MYGSVLRTCALGAVVCVLFGAGIGYGWHYLDTGGRSGAVVSAATAVAKQDEAGPPPSNPSLPRETGVVEGGSFPGWLAYGKIGALLPANGCGVLRSSRPRQTSCAPS